MSNPTSLTDFTLEELVDELRSRVDVLVAGYSRVTSETVLSGTKDVGFLIKGCGFECRGLTMCLMEEVEACGDDDE